ncbi:MAG: SH3 domain-containing protein [Natronohydrobacter sp.]|nr:SH3 domain-containing protein [Natronohydrobacter sp.]
MAFNLLPTEAVFRNLLAAAFLSASAVAGLAQGSSRAEPVTGAGVTTIGGIATHAAVNVRVGPAPVFPVVATLGYGTRVQKGYCIGGGSAQWCKIETMDGRIEGYVAGRFLVSGDSRPPDGGIEDGGPDYWVVTGIPAGSRLNVRRDPSTNAPALATLSEGEIVQNLGCQIHDRARWCRIRSIIGMDVTGWVAGRYLSESRGPIAIQPPAGGAHGPDFYVVHGLAAGDSLNIRAEPSAQSAILGRLNSGARVRNLGCRQSGSTRWCRIETTGGVVVNGWVNGRYLREG